MVNLWTYTMKIYLLGSSAQWIWRILLKEVSFTCEFCKENTSERLLFTAWKVSVFVVFLVVVFFSCIPTEYRNLQALFTQGSIPKFMVLERRSWKVSSHHLSDSNHICCPLEITIVNNKIVIIKCFPLKSARSLVFRKLLWTSQTTSTSSKSTMETLAQCVKSAQS